MADIVYTKTKNVLPPSGPFYKLNANPIIPSTLAAGGGYLAENIVFDSVTAKYWMAFSNFTTAGAGAVGLASSVDLLTWTLDYPTLLAAGSIGAAPCILFDNGLWYIFYCKYDGVSKVNMFQTSSTSITGPYGSETQILTAGVSGWDSTRVMEPYVFKDGSQYVMFYMGDAGPVGTDLSLEQIGYATAPALTGPWTKYAGNPVIPFGAPGSFDAGVVADPSVIKVNGTYYIVYSCGPSIFPPHTSALVTTTDLIHFTKHGTILPYNGSSTYEKVGAVRGAIQRFGDFYYYSYSGRNGGTDGSNALFQPAMAIAPATQSTFNTWTKAPI